MTPQEAHTIATEVHMKKYDECFKQINTIISVACNQGLYSIQKKPSQTSIIVNDKVYDFSYNDIIIQTLLDALINEGWTISIHCGEKIGFVIEW